MAIENRSVCGKYHFPTLRASLLQRSNKFGREKHDDDDEEE